MVDSFNTLRINIKSDLQGVMSTLKDGNIPVRNIWDTLDWANPNPNHLPLIQFEVISPPSSSEYLGDSLEDIPFSVRFICWVNSKNDKRDAGERAMNLRETLVSALHNERPFSNTGAARQSLRINRESNPFLMKRFAFGMGLIISGDILQTAGAA